MTRVIATLATLATLLWFSPALAAPPPGADTGGAIGQWYQSLRQPDTGYGCCSIADCRPVAARHAPHGWQALLDDEWVDIPPGKIIRDEIHPAGQAVACWHRSGSIEAESSTVTVFCFVLPGAGI